MNCPVCQVELKMTERQGVEIDYCPKCRGVWLDRGELDKIIERTVSTPYPIENDHHDEHYDVDNDHRHGRHRRGGLLGDMFDIFD